MSVFTVTHWQASVVATYSSEFKASAMQHVTHRVVNVCGNQSPFRMACGPAGRTVAKAMRAIHIYIIRPVVRPNPFEHKTEFALSR